MTPSQEREEDGGGRGWGRGGDKVGNTGNYGRGRGGRGVGGAAALERGGGFVRGRRGGAAVHEAGQGEDGESVEGLGWVVPAVAATKSSMKESDGAVENESIGDIQNTNKDLQAKLVAKEN